MKKLFLVLFSFIFIACKAQDRPVIYQMMVRLFGNKNMANVYYGSIDQNGVGKFNDISDRALDSLKTLGLSHIWYTGVIAHASMADYSSYGIATDDPDVVKGRAGSPYAIRDYYDVDPDLAVDVNKRMEEFLALVDRTHQHGLKVIIDFVPNHVARTYHSNYKPNGVLDFGAKDDTSVEFSNQNDFYYLPGTSFIVPKGVNAGGEYFHSPQKDSVFYEKPAKATGNNVFKQDPSVDDWYETIKLNYGIDVQHKANEHFLPIPSVWKKMLSILLYWCSKGVDGFRCDMAEMVPVAFWHWAITQVKETYPKTIFIAEAYNPKIYQAYIQKGKFDFLYDKVGMYDAVKRLVRNEKAGNVATIDSIENSFTSRVLIRFLENHDEERIASKQFAGDPSLAIPGMVVISTLAKNPVMVYFGQEVGEKAIGKEGFGGDDGRTSLFDYWGVPAQQAWMDNERFDGAMLTATQKNLRATYRRLLVSVNSDAAIQKGEYLPLKVKGLTDRQKIYARVFKGEIVLVAVNFDRDKAINQYIYLPKIWRKESQLPAGVSVYSILDGIKIGTLNLQNPILVKVPSSGAIVWNMH